MKTIVDTSVWSLALRRDSSKNSEIREKLEFFISNHLVQMIGPIRQELLSGIQQPLQFEKLKATLQAFPDYIIKTSDFELAAQFYNLCRKSGIQGSNTDFLICAIAVHNGWQIFTTDNDFQLFNKVIPLTLVEI